MDSDLESDEDYELCIPDGGNSCTLPFDPICIENIILTISDKFDFRVILSDDRAKGAIIVTTGLALAGGIFGKHYGGKIGMAIGGAIGGACGLGVVAVSMREVWNDIKLKLHELFEIVYDYLAGMGLDDYRRAATVLTTAGDTQQLAMLVLNTASSILGKKIISSLAAD